MWWGQQGRSSSYASIVASAFNRGQPSEDVLNYNLTRTEALLNDKFTDYIYNIAETLTRDYVQTTYTPSFKDFNGLPKFITGATEATTGLDYVVDGTGLKFWNELKNDATQLNTSIYNAIRISKYDKYIERVKNFFFAEKALIKNYDQKIAQTEKLIKDNEAKQTKNDKEKREKETLISSLNQALSNYNKARIDATRNRQNTIAPFRRQIYGSYIASQRNLFSRNEIRESSYFGNLISKNNGYFKDRFQKEKIGMQLYNDDGSAYQDTSIRLKDFEGNAITSRPKAFFISQLLNYGVGSRNVSGLFRNKDKDAMALYGYTKNDVANRIKYIRFIDKDTKEAKYLEVNIKGTNNVFYFETQGDASSKKTVEDFGYTSWVSDFGVMAKYRDTLLSPKHAYYVDFVDQDYNFVENFNLGDLNFLSENGKTSTQSPVKLIAETDPKTNQKTNKVLISIDYQFNITG
ncbi:hypothetical protein [Mycoplasma leonicaptivi]|uniref:hypothetical protein n=1 Tax=Mycoplasma leonicaptivi TaxID=36742 RepID=UPI000485DD98|nr:hypothetical protein [Mycoplasma leonicaptivi]